MNTLLKTCNLRLIFFIFRLLCINLAVPIMQITLFCFCIGQPPKSLPVGYMNRDTLGFNMAMFNIVNNFNIGQEIIDEMDNHRIVKVIRLEMIFLLLYV